MSKSFPLVLNIDIFQKYCISVRNFSIVTTLIGSLLFLITSLNQSVVQRLTVHLHFLTRQKMCLKKERHDRVIIFVCLFVCCTSTLG